MTNEGRETFAQPYRGGGKNYAKNVTRGSI